MNKSETISSLAKSLVAAQEEMSNPKKNASNPFFKSKYADLAEIINAAKPILAKNGISVVQLSGYQDGLVTVETILLHESGEFISGIMATPPIKADAQGVGSGLTYIRRYSLAAICLLAQEDDDGNEAVAKKKPKAKPVPEIVAQFAAVDSIDGLHKLWEKTENRGLYAADKDAAKERLA